MHLYAKFDDPTMYSYWDINLNVDADVDVDADADARGTPIVPLNFVEAN